MQQEITNTPLELVKEIILDEMIFICGVDSAGRFKAQYNGNNVSPFEFDETYNTLYKLYKNS